MMDWIIDFVWYQQWRKSHAYSGIVNQKLQASLVYAEQLTCLSMSIENYQIIAKNMIVVKSWIR